MNAITIKHNIPVSLINPDDYSIEDDIVRLTELLDDMYWFRPDLTVTDFYRVSVRLDLVLISYINFIGSDMCQLSPSLYF